MEFFADGPAVLGGILMSVALAAWTLGRWQGGLAMPADATVPSPREFGENRMMSAPLQAASAPGEDPARAERRRALVAADSLGELHAEISAYRRAEQVLAGPEADGLRLRPLRDDARKECRYLGVTGEPTCGLADPARITCTGGIRCACAEPLPIPLIAERLRQPSRPVSALTRV